MHSSLFCPSTLFVAFGEDATEILISSDKSLRLEFELIILVLLFCSKFTEHVGEAECLSS